MIDYSEFIAKMKGAGFKEIDFGNESCPPAWCLLKESVEGYSTYYNSRFGYNYL